MKTLFAAVTTLVALSAWQGGCEKKNDQASHASPTPSDAQTLSKTTAKEPTAPDPISLPKAESWTLTDASITFHTDKSGSCNADNKEDDSSVQVHVLNKAGQLIASNDSAGAGAKFDEHEHGGVDTVSLTIAASSVDPASVIGGKATLYFVPGPNHQNDEWHMSFYEVSLKFRSETHVQTVYGKSSRNPCVRLKKDEPNDECTLN